MIKYLNIFEFILSSIIGATIGLLIFFLFLKISDFTQNKINKREIKKRYEEIQKEENYKNEQLERLYNILRSNIKNIND